MISKDESGRLIYLEKENEALTARDILWQSQGDMPEVEWQNLWLQEDGHDTLRAPEGYETYIWQSSNWPDSSYVGNNKFVVNEPGFHHCYFFDKCLHMSALHNFTNQFPHLKSVSTNLETNKRLITWKSYEGSAYDTVCIFKNEELVGFAPFDDEIWEDTARIEGKFDTARYSISPNIMQNERSKAHTGPKLNFESINPNLHELYLTIEGPTKEGSETENFVQFYQLYSIQENGSFGLEVSMIPTDVNGIQFDTYEEGTQLVLAAVLSDNSEIYSNIVTIDELTNIEEKSIDINIFPNPTRGFLNISAFINAEYSIFNNHGQLVKTGNINGSQINVSELVEGIYFIVLERNKTVLTRKKIVIN